MAQSTVSGKAVPTSSTSTRFVPPRPRERESRSIVPEGPNIYEIWRTYKGTGDPNLRNLLSGNLASAWMADTVRTLREKMSNRLGMAMQDGGVPVSGFVAHLSPEEWHQVAADFLMSETED